MCLVLTVWLSSTYRVVKKFWCLSTLTLMSTMVVGSMGGMQPGSPFPPMGAPVAGSAPAQPAAPAGGATAPFPPAQPAGAAPAAEGGSADDLPF